MVKRAAAGATLCATVGIALGAAPTSAQQPASGWLGVRVQQRYDCVWETQEEWKRCDLLVQVREMQENGPASSGGLEVGDRLIAIDGEDITLQNWAQLVTSFQPGRPVSVDVMRDGDRHFARILPTRRPPNPERLTWVRPTGQSAAREEGPRVYVFMLTEAGEPGQPAVALTVRDTEDMGVSVEPSAVRVVDGQLRLLPLRDGAFPELPELRRELVGDLEQATESTYRSATNAFEVFDRVRDRLSSSEFQRRMARIAQVGLEEAGLAVRFNRSFAGAEFEPVRRFSRRTGLLVLSVVEGTVAARLGLRPGDLVVRVGERPTREIRDLVEATRVASVDSVKVHWIRDGRELSRIWPGK